MTQHFISFEEAKNDILACAGFLAEDISGGEDQAEAIAATLPGFLSRNEVDLAAELANTIDDPFMRDRLLTRVAAKCAELDDDEYALQLADAIEEDGLRSQALEMLALIKAEKGEIKEAMRLSEMVPHPDIVLAGIAAKQASMGDEEAALQTISGIDFPRTAAEAFISIAELHAEREEFEKAAESLEAAHKNALEIEHNEDKIRTLIEIGNRYIDAKRPDAAIRTFELAREAAEELDNIHRDAFLASISTGFFSAGSIDLADRTLSLMTDKMQIAIALLSFSALLWNDGKKEEAIESLDEAYDVLRSQRENETRDSKAKFSLFASIAEQFADFGRGERAIGIAEIIGDEGQKSYALSRIAHVLMLQKNEMLARNALGAIPGEGSRVFAMIGMGNAAAQSGEREAGLALLAESSEMAGELTQISVRASALNTIIEHYIDMGEEKRARELTLKCLSAIGELRIERSRVSALAALAGIYDRAGFSPNEAERDLLLKVLVPSRS